MIATLKKINRDFLILERTKNFVAKFFTTVFNLNHPNKWSLLIARSLVGLNQNVPTKHGALNLSSTSPLLLYRATSFFSKEPETIEWLDQMTTADTFFDIGANVGLYSLYAGLKGVKTLAFEPVFYNFALLNQNIAANKLSQKIISYPLAISDKMNFGKMTLNSLESGSAFNTFNGEDQKSNITQGCVAYSLDELIFDYKFPVPSFIKIDVDGLESQIILGMKKTITNSQLKSILIEINEGLDSDLKILNTLQSAGFTVSARGEVALNFKLPVRNYIFTRV